MTQPSEKRAICLLSGGLDSATALAIARSEGYSCYCLSFDYGQRHSIEIEAAAKVAQQLGAQEHRTVRINLREFGGSALTSNLPVPKDRDTETSHEIPITYVPARNTIFLSFALAYAEITSSSHIFLGVNAIDYSGYPDCRPEFISAFETMANLATKAGVEGLTKIQIHSPLILMTKADIVKAAVEHGVDLKLTHSCYDPAPNGRPCGHCDACILRRKGFEEAGIIDPVTL